MKNLTFDDVMGFCEPNNASIFAELKTAHQRQQLTPFVGAGLSVFCGYKLWPQILNELASYLTRKEQQEEALQMIQNNQYLEAAQYIQDRYRRILHRLPSIIDYKKIKNCAPRDKKQSAAWVLPWLFSNRPVMTTNFDSVLETLFREKDCPFQQVVQPHDPSLLTQTRQGNLHNLFKLHGEIGQDAAALDRLVFTKNKYDTIYAKNGELCTELNQWYENQKLLFLGCSLAMDKTMEVLKAAVDRNPGITHYAIVGCKKEQIDTQRERLGELGIDAIFYDDSDHHAVRVVLERLLEKNNPAAYQDFKRASWLPPEREKGEGRLMFNAEYFAFTGRQAEMQALEDFCNAEENTLWWAVTGPGGMGKSRLVYECCKKMEQQNWNTAWFEATPSNGRSIQELPTWTPPVHQTLVVLDDVQAHMEIVKAWMDQISRGYRSSKLRILLLEREGKDLEDASWMDLDEYNDTLDTWCHDETFLSLQAMTDADLMAIMDNYAAADGKTLNAQLLLKTLERVDPKLKRPMYAIAIADARCSGSDPTSWNKEKVLDMLVDRELKFHFNRIKGMGDIKLSKSLRAEVEELLAHTCIQGFIKIEEIDTSKYKQLAKVMDKLNMEPQEFFQRMGVLSTVHLTVYESDENGHPLSDPSEESTAEVITMSCPDLVKEHLVLDLALEKKRMELLFPAEWENHPGQLLFLRRLLADHHEQLKQQDAYWGNFFKGTPKTGFPAELYGNILWGVTAFCPERRRAASDRLEALYKDCDKYQQIGISFAHGLFNLTVDPPVEERCHTVQRLEELHQSHLDCEEIAIVFAKGLVNLSADQPMAERQQTVQRLDKLHQTYSDCERIATQFANGLVNLMIVQLGEERRSTVERLEALYQSHSDNQEIVIWFAKGLAYSCEEPTIAECQRVVQHLDELYQRHPNCLELIQILAGVLVDQAFIQNNTADILTTLKASNQLLNQYPDDIYIQLCYAKTWFNLTLRQDEVDIPGTVAQIADFLRSHPDALPKFREALKEYLEKHPEHTERYRLLRKL